MEPRPAGVLLTACLALCLFSPAAVAATTDWWRFESTPGFLADSVGAVALTVTGDAHAAVLPASGRGSKFPHGFSPIGGNPNLSAAEFDGSFDGLTAPLAFPSGDFTVECFAHVDSTVSGTSTFVGYSDPTNLSTGNSWTLQFRIDGVGGMQPREFYLGGFTGGFPMQVGFLLLGSGIILELGKDYYLAVSFDQITSPTPSVATFYVKNLTDNGPLQVVTKSQATQPFIAATTVSIGGLAPGGGGSLDGLIDEVRLSTHVVQPADLLVNQIGPPVPALPGFTALLVAIALGLVAVGAAWNSRRVGHE